MWALKRIPVLVTVVSAPSPESHPSPIRIKARQRRQRVSLCRPWHVVPQRTVGTRPRPWRSHTVQNSWLPAGSTLHVVRSRGDSVPSLAMRVSGWAGAGLIRNDGLAAIPLYKLRTPAHESLTRRTRVSPETGPGPARCDNRRAPVYAPRPSGRRTPPYGPPSAGRTGGSVDRSESRSGPLQRTPN